MELEQSTPQVVETAPHSRNMSKLGEQEPSAKAAFGPRQIYALVGYYVILLVGSILALILFVRDPTILGTALLAKVGFVAIGAIAGSILYQIRMLFRHYIKHEDFDSKWLGKYISAPWEAVALALAILALIQGGGVVLGGDTFTMDKGEPFAAFGLGTLIGFGIREAIGWLGNLAKTVFPTESKPESKP